MPDPNRPQEAFRELRRQMKAYLAADPDTPLADAMQRVIAAINCALTNPADPDQLVANWVREEMDKFVEVARGC